MTSEARFTEIYHYYQYITYLLAKEEFCYPNPNYGSFFSRQRVVDAWRTTRARIDDGEAPSRLALYVHVPFCECGCLYCMSGTVRVRRRGAYLDQYLQYLFDEMAIYQSLVGDLPVSTVYIGGGSPSLLDAAQIERLIGELRTRYGVGDDTRLIFEASPFTMDRRKLAALERCGVHELALGVQSLDQEVLDANRRPQKVRPTIDLIDRAVRSSIPSVTVDLMVGMPYQSEQSALVTAAQLIELDVDGIMVNEFLPLAYIRFCGEGHRYTAQDHIDKKAAVDAVRELLGESGFRPTPAGYRRRWTADDAARVYKTQEVDNLLGFGYGSYSHAHGTLKYQLLYPFLDFAGQLDGPSWMAPDSGLQLESMFDAKLMDKYQAFASTLDDDPYTYVGLEMTPDREMHVYAYSHLYDLELGAFRDRFGLDFATVFRNALLILASEGVVGIREGKLAFLRKDLVSKRTARTLFVDKPYIHEVLRVNDEPYDHNEDYASMIVHHARTIS